LPQNIFPCTIAVPHRGQVAGGGDTVWAATGAAVTGVPHLPQNFFPGTIVVPHRGQVAGGGDTVWAATGAVVTGVPQFSQNFSPGFSWFPQDRQHFWIISLDSTGSGGEGVTPPGIVSGPGIFRESGSSFAQGISLRYQSNSSFSNCGGEWFVSGWERESSDFVFVTGRVILWPHIRQNFEFAGIWESQDGQIIISGIIVYASLELFESTFLSLGFSHILSLESCLISQDLDPGRGLHHLLW